MAIGVARRTGTSGDGLATGVGWITVGSGLGAGCAMGSGVSRSSSCETSSLGGRPAPVRELLKSDGGCPSSISEEITRRLVIGNDILLY
jgi:hypothetical protein